MNSKKVLEVVLAIRQLAADKQFTICRNTKTPDWKNKMLNLLSDEVVVNHLVTLHPFQFRRGNDATQVYEFCISYYRYNVYLKVNLKQQEVLSFHYDEYPGDAKVAPYATEGLYVTPEDNDTTALFTDIQVVVESGLPAYKGFVCRFAIGSQLATVPVQPLVERDSATIPLQDYKDAVQAMAKGFQKRYLSKVVTRAQIEQRELLQGADSYNILSYDEKSPVQLASIGFDLYNNYPMLYYAQDLAIDLLLQIPPKLLEQFQSQLYVGMDKVPQLPASPETLLMDYDM